MKRLAGLVFLSGASALVYQVVWQRLLTTVFGVTVYATSTVLAAFMGGLALGSVLGGRIADGRRRPLRLLAVVEAAIGLSALATPWALAAVERLYTTSHASVGASFAALTTARLACALLVLLVPTTLMGATLPILAAALPMDADRRARALALLYGFNTLGACAGALAAGQWLIGAVGQYATVCLAVAGNLVVALGALLAAARADGGSAGTVAETRTPAAELSPGQARTLLAAFTASGFIALGLEVAWFRMLLAYLPTTTYAFSTMLVTVLAGLGVGSLLMVRPPTGPGALARLGLRVALTGVVSIASATVLARTYAAGWRTSGLVQACVVALLPPAILMGMTYPHGLALWSGSSPRLGRRVGLFSAANLAGAIAGALVTGFVLIPTMGVRASLAVLSAGSMLAGVALALVDDAQGRTRRPALAVVVALFVLGLATLPDPFAAARGRRHRGETLLWIEEDVQGTVAVHRTSDGGKVMYIDGTHQAGDSRDTQTLHHRIGLVPLLLHRAPREVLVIGLAGGTTPGAMALYPGVRVDVVELSSAVVRASDFFRHVNGDLLRRPNVRLVLDDGRNHLLLSRARYDVITADLVQPFHAGAGHLYSAEYFRLCRRALTDSGLMVQWIGHPPEEQYRLLLRTFLSVFPEATLWEGSFLVGPRGSLRAPSDDFEAAHLLPELARALAEADIADATALLRLYTAGPAALRAFAGPGPVLTDDRPQVEYYRSLGDGGRRVDLSRLPAADPLELTR